jgi:Bacteriophage HK97-gp10, putative tail-component
MPVVIEGLAELRAELRAAADATPREVTKALRGGAAKVAARAVQLAPVGKTGQLAASGKAFSTQRAAGVRFSAPYAGVAEFKRGGGWFQNHGPTPRFAYRAVDELGPGLVQEAFDALTEILRCHGFWSG